MSEPVIICHPTIPHVSAVLPLWVRVSIDPWDLCNRNNLDTNPSLYIYVHGGSSLTSIFLWFLRRSRMADGRQQTTCGEQNTTGRTMRVRVLYPLFTAASCFFCHSICHLLLSSCSLVLNTCRIPRHTCRKSSTSTQQEECDSGGCALH